MPATLFKLAYQLRNHYFAEVPLDRWIATLTLGAAALLTFVRVTRGLDRTSASTWWAVGVLVALALLVLVLRYVAARAGYVHFRPQVGLLPPADLPMPPVDKVLIHATGLFEVEGKSHFFADLLAYWRTFATREHTVMAIVHPSRFLGIAEKAPQDLGMWYIFFCPEKIKSITPGILSFGQTQRLALCVRYLRPPVMTGRRRLWAWLRRTLLRTREEKGVLATVHLCADTEETRRRIWADLIVDEGVGSWQ